MDYDKEQEEPEPSWDEKIKGVKEATNEAIADSIPYNEDYADYGQEELDKLMSRENSNRDRYDPYGRFNDVQPGQLRGVAQEDEDWAQMPKREITNKTASTIGSKFNTQSNINSIRKDVELNRDNALINGNTKDVVAYYTNPELRDDLGKLVQEPSYTKGTPSYKRIAKDETKRNHAGQIIDEENKIKDKINQQVAMNNDPATRQAYIEQHYPDLAKRNTVKELQDLNNYRLSLLEDPAKMLQDMKDDWEFNSGIPQTEDSHDYTDDQEEPDTEQISGTSVVEPEATYGHPFIRKKDE